MTGLDALRASVGENEGDGVGVLLGTLVAALGALLVLAFVFRSFMAFVPLLMAFVAIPTTFLLIWPLATVTDVSVIVQFLVGLIGLGIAIDYALLVVVRWREERQQPNVTNERAVRNAMEHAGSAVVFSGTTVAISLLALLALPVPFLRSIGIAGLMIALVSVAVAVTLLPVVLATIGPRFDWPRNRRDAQASRGWSAWARLIVRHRWVAAIASTGVLVGLVFAASTIQSGTRARRRSQRSGLHARALRSSRSRESGRDHSRPSTRSFAQVTPKPWRSLSARSRVSAALQHPETGVSGNGGRRRDPDRGRELRGRPRDARPHPCNHASGRSLARR